jgi:hypothetical protein
MMQRAIILLLTLFYFTLSSGVALTAHYCGGKAVEVVWGDAEKDCCKGKPVTSKHCCDNHFSYIKVKAEHAATEAKIPQASFIVAVLSYNNNPLATCNTTATAVRPGKAPPSVHPGKPVYLLKNVFLI